MVILETCINNRISNQDVRATILSVKGQIDSLGQIGGGPIIGIIGNVFSIKIAIFVCAIILSPILYFYRIVMRNRKIFKMYE